VYQFQYFGQRLAVSRLRARNIQAVPLLQREHAVCGVRRFDGQEQFAVKPMLI
jgi:hypothetical protein